MQSVGQEIHSQSDDKRREKDQRDLTASFQPLPEGRENRAEQCFSVLLSADRKTVIRTAGLEKE